MRTPDQIIKDMSRVKSAQLQLIEDYKNNIVNMTELEYHDQLIELSDKMATLNNEKAEADKAFSLRFGI
jgi:hypothetical protein